MTNPGVVDSADGASGPAPRWRAGTLWAAAAGCWIAALSVLFLVLLNESAPTALDTAVWDATTSWTDSASWAVSLAEVYGKIMDIATSVVVATALTVWAIVMGQRRVGLFVALTGLVGVTVAETLKLAVGRTRPPGAEAFQSDLEKSFPSGHAMAGVYVYVTAAVVLVLFGMARSQPGLKVIGRILAALGILMGISRIVLGVHWTTDVVAGWLFASAVLFTFTALLRPDAQLLGAADAVPQDRAGPQATDGERS
jgi:membrane-associated phospholipid phosphatase